MQANDLISGLRSGRIGRRAFLKALPSFGIVATAMPLLPRRARAEVNITYFTWAGYDIPDIHPAFIAKYGASPNFSTFGEEEEALQKLLAGFTPDVTHPCSSNTRRWHAAGVIKPIDVSRIAAWEDLFPSLKSVHGVSIDNEVYLAPFEWGNTSITYRPDLVDIDEESYALLLDERYRGRMAMFDSSEEAAVVGGLIAGVAKPFDMSPEEIDKSFEVMRRIHANLRFYWTDVSELAQALASGELVAATSWNETVVTLKQQGVPVKYMHPKEGVLTWVCGLALVKDGAGDEQQKYDLINAMLDPEVGVYMVNQYGYGHSNSKSYELVERSRLEELGIEDPDALLVRTTFFDEMPAEMRETVNGKFEEVKAGL